MKIVQYPHPSLRTKAEPILSITKELQIQAGEMLELMYRNEGLGLAAPQVALPVRMLVMNFRGAAEEKDSEFVAINPVIIESSKATLEDREGCLSFPDLFARVRRFKTVKVQAYNLKGELYEMVASDLAARVWQHEIDHLDAVLFIDKMGMLGRHSSRKALKQFEQEFYDAKKKGDLPKDMEPRF
jgi:peptide deformylase